MWKLVVALCLVVGASAQNWNAEGGKGKTHKGAYGHHGAYPYGYYPGYYGFGFGFPYNYHGFPYNYHHPKSAPVVPHPHPAVHPKAPVYQPHPKAPVHSSQLTYKGAFDGTCEGKDDGLYYVDERSFAFCSGGIKTIQACAEGSINPPHGDFSSGKYQHYYDFCSINIAARDYVGGH